MKKLPLALFLALTPLLAQSPRVISTDVDPAGSACTLTSPPFQLLYSSLNTQEICTCQSSVFVCEAIDGAGGGGGGTPGGSDTHVQYNDSGSFGGEAAFSYNDGTDTLSVTNIIGTVSAATALAADPTDCSAGDAPVGIDASGNAVSCTTYVQGPGSATDEVIPRFNGTSGASFEESPLGFSTNAGLQTEYLTWAETAVATSPVIAVNTDSQGAIYGMGAFSINEIQSGDPFNEVSLRGSAVTNEVRGIVNASTTDQQTARLHLRANGGSSNNLVEILTDNTARLTVDETTITSTLPIDAGVNALTGNLECTGCVGAAEIAPNSVGTSELDESAEYNFTGAIDFEHEVRFDWDGDSNYEKVTIGPDYDGDTTAEMTDIWDAIADYCGNGTAITTCPEGGLKMELVLDSYAPPGANNAETTDAIVELPSNFILDCQGATLNGFPDADTTSTQAVLGVLGQDDVTIQNCVIDGGSTLASVSVAGARMGIYVKNSGATSSTDILIQNNRIANTDHTGIYVKNTERFLVTNNIVNGTDDQPTYYVFADNSDTTRDGVISNNISVASGGNGINFRRSSGSETLENVWGISNVVIDCDLFAIEAAGTKHSGFIGTTVRGCGALSVSASTNYWDDGTPDTEGTIDLYVSGLDAYIGTFSPGIRLGTNHDGITLSDVIIRGDDGTTVGQDGIEIQQPHRRLKIDNLSVKEIEDDAVLVVNNSGTEHDEYVIFDGLRLEGINGSWIQTSGSLTLSNWHFRNFDVRDVNGLTNLSGAVTDSSWGPGVCNMHWTTGETNRPCLQFIVATHARNVFQGITFMNQNGHHGILFNSGDCDDCIARDLFAIDSSTDVTDMEGAIDVNGTGPWYLANIHCVGETDDCVARATNTEIRIGGVEDLSVVYYGVGTTGASDCPTGGDVKAGDRCIDEDGDGSTDCGGGECFMLVYDGAAWEGVEN